MTWISPFAPERYEALPEIAGVRPEFVGIYPVTSTNAERWSEANLVLLGDACNTLHPGRSQGMNVAMRAAHRLVQLLIAGDALASLEVRRPCRIQGQARQCCKQQADQKSLQGRGVQTAWLIGPYRP